MRRVIIAGGFAIAAAAPVVGVTLASPVISPSHLADCPTGEEQDLYSGQCTPYLVPNSPDAAPAAPAAAPAPAADTTGASPSLCPPGVSGSECGGSTGGEASAPQPRMPAAVPPQEPEQELAEVVTPDY
ncbi:hypothetical protein BHQ17_16655 [Mycolicibacterium holsaticum]|uniref:Intersectin-EH binding protein Ibp1 n=1 Tax=Mycolicibacterium holsaticum TaxID=152142 RepID=A0A1E3RQT5_9MYCO|nr:hypothetical protein BHQ17_16655 [Mycolicibacterium holsaticum]QZA15139.1 hypothetical protein K3U96_05690 [Mycolicibacterium holsaticum DSM 44478 = JCM 12374]UNC12591.1 hypothetical protein H5U41_21145 [Mycolicibacterium holsaticum DSM 44478 = JCM 12374]